MFARSLALSALVALFVSAIGCSNGVGANCQLDSDCASGLSCCNAGLPRGTCQSSGSCVTTADAAVSTEDDAFTPAEDDAFTPAEDDAATTTEDDAAADVDGGT